MPNLNGTGPDGRGPRTGRGRGRCGRRKQGDAGAPTRSLRGGRGRKGGERRLWQEFLGTNKGQGTKRSLSEQARPGSIAGQKHK
jgi:hypothetical protein